MMINDLSRLKTHLPFLKSIRDEWCAPAARLKLSPWDGGIFCTQFIPACHAKPRIVHKIIVINGRWNKQKVNTSHESCILHGSTSTQCVCVCSVCSSHSVQRFCCCRWFFFRGLLTHSHCGALSTAYLSE